MGSGQGGGEAAQMGLSWFQGSFLSRGHVGMTPLAPQQGVLEGACWLGGWSQVSLWGKGGCELRQTRWEWEDDPNPGAYLISLLCGFRPSLDPGMGVDLRCIFLHSV